MDVVVLGLGEIGRLVAGHASRHPDLRLVGVVDPALAGTRLRELVAEAPNLVVEKDPAAVYRKARGGVALICTGSTLEAVAPAIEAAVGAGLHVVSTCEELAAPRFVDPELADTLDLAAKRSGVAILGTGVNPGFVLDRLVVTLGAVVGDVRKVEATRRVDLGTRRRALRKKIGLGLSLEEFEERGEAGELGHVGLSESCALVADGLGLTVDEVEEELEPVVAEREITLGDETIAAGRIRGLRQIARAFDEGREVIRLTLELAAGVTDPEDRIRVDADPPIELAIPGGIQGDRATAWAVVNAAPRVAAAEAGIIEVLDLPAGR
nr:hypothetical protein [Vulgatibacter incomptus]